MKLAGLSLLAAGAKASTVVLTNSAMSVPGNTTIWSVDMATGSAQLLGDHTLDEPAVAGVVCDNVYYTVFAEIMAGFGLSSFDLATGERTDYHTQSLWHVIACDPKGSGKLLGTASDFTSVEAARNPVGVGDVPFHLKSFDFATQTESVVGTFPASDVKWGGYDGIFSFTQDGTEVWAAWPADECPYCDDAKKGGHVHVMDTSSGEIKTSTSISFSGKKGTPYFLLPDAKRGVFATKGGMDRELKWGDIEVSGSSIKVNIGSTDASDLWDSSSAPPQMCGDHVLAFSKGSVSFGASVVKEISPETGSVINSVDLLSALEVPDRTNIGAVACIKPTEDFSVV